MAFYCGGSMGLPTFLAVEGNGALQHRPFLIIYVLCNTLYFITEGICLAPRTEEPQRYIFQLLSIAGNNLN